MSIDRLMQSLGFDVTVDKWGRVTGTRRKGEPSNADSDSRWVAACGRLCFVGAVESLVAGARPAMFASG
jgi:hypothetical protein